MLLNLTVSIEDDDTRSWDLFKNAHRSAAEEVLGFRRHSRYEWISQPSRQLIEKKRKARLYNDHAECKRLTKQSRKSVRQDKQRWADAKAELVELYLQGGPKKRYPNFIFAITSVNVHRF